MKNYIYLIVLFCFTGITHAQHRLESSLNMFRSDDVLIKQQVSYKDPGRTGGNVLWDFSQLDVVNDAYELHYFPGDKGIVIGMEHSTLYHYSLSNDSLFLLGFENQTTLIKNKQPELLLRFPVRYGDRFGSYFYGHGKYGNRLDVDEMGSIETSADSYGMLILPSKDTLKQVLRTRTLKIISEESRPITEEYYRKDTAQIQIPVDSIVFRLSTDSVVFIMETFRWYEKGYRYPIFETVRSWEQHLSGSDQEFLATAFFYPPQEQYYLAEDLDNQALLEEQALETDTGTMVDPWEGLSYNLFPNPIKDSDLRVELYLPKPVDDIHIQVHNPVGLVVYDRHFGSYSIGTHTFPVDFWSLPVGNYVLDLWLDDKKISEIILKR